MPKTLSSGDYSSDPWLSPQVPSAPFFDLMPLLCPYEPAPPPLTVNLSQLVVPSGTGDRDEHISPLSPPLLSFLFSDPQLDTNTLAVPPSGQSPLPKIPENRSCKQEYSSSPDLSFDSPSANFSSDEEYHESASDVPSTEPTTPRHVHRALSSRTLAVQGETEVVSKLNGHPVLRYPNDSYRCMSIVTAGGKISQYTRKSERPPNVGQPCIQTFRGRDEIVRHLKTSRWHTKLDECKLLTCEVCGQQLSRKDSLSRHMRTMHLSTLFILRRLVNEALTPHFYCQSTRCRCPSLQQPTANAALRVTNQPRNFPRGLSGYDQRFLTKSSRLLPS